MEFANLDQIWVFRKKFLKVQRLSDEFPKKLARDKKNQMLASRVNQFIENAIRLSRE